MKYILKNDITIAILIVSIFIFIVSLSSIYTYSNISKGTACTCAFPIYLIIPLVSSLGLASGSFVYYFASGKLRDAKSKRKEIIKSVFKLFDINERKILQEISKNEEITQAAISKSTNLDRVKIHRIISALKDKGIINKEEKGKTYILSLSEEFKFLKNK